VIHFVRNVTGGLTTLERASDQTSRILKTCNGFTFKDGRLRPELLNAQGSAATAVADWGPFPEQTPVVIGYADGVSLNAYQLRTTPTGLPPYRWMAVNPDLAGLFDFGWLTPPDNPLDLDGIKDAPGIQYKTKAIIPTIGPYPALWAVEGASGATIDDCSPSSRPANTTRQQNRSS